jgi:hypothetical protein
MTFAARAAAACRPLSLKTMAPNAGAVIRLVTLFEYGQANESSTGEFCA